MDFSIGKRKEDILRKIKELESYRDKKLKEYEILLSRLVKGELSDEEYLNIINKQFNGLSEEEFLLSINEKIQKYKNKLIKEYSKRNIKEKHRKKLNKKLTLAIINFAILAFIIPLMLNNSQNFTGFLVSEPNLLNTNTSSFNIHTNNKTIENNVTQKTDMENLTPQPTQETPSGIKIIKHPTSKASNPKEENKGENEEHNIPSNTGQTAISTNNSYEETPQENITTDSNLTTNISSYENKSIALISNQSINDLVNLTNLTNENILIENETPNASTVMKNITSATINETNALVNMTYNNTVYNITNTTNITQITNSSYSFNQTINITNITEGIQNTSQNISLNATFNISNVSLNISQNLTNIQINETSINNTQTIQINQSTINQTNNTQINQTTFNQTTVLTNITNLTSKRNETLKENLTELKISNITLQLNNTYLFNISQRVSNNFSYVIINYDNLRIIQKEKIFVIIGESLGTFRLKLIINLNNNTLESNLFYVNVINQTNLNASYVNQTHLITNDSNQFNRSKIITVNTTETNVSLVYPHNTTFNLAEFLSNTTYALVYDTNKVDVLIDKSILTIIPRINKNDSVLVKLLLEHMHNVTFNENQTTNITALTFHIKILENTSLETIKNQTFNQTTNITQNLTINKTLNQSENKTEINLSLEINHLPKLVYNLSNLTLIRNLTLTINLSTLFYDRDNDDLSYLSIVNYPVISQVEHNILSLYSLEPFNDTKTLKIIVYDGKNMTIFNFSLFYSYLNVTDKSLLFTNKIKYKSFNNTFRYNVRVNKPTEWSQKIKIVNDKKLWTYRYTSLILPKNSFNISLSLNGLSVRRINASLIDQILSYLSDLRENSDINNTLLENPTNETIDSNDLSASNVSTKIFNKTNLISNQTNMTILESVENTDNITDANITNISNNSTYNTKNLKLKDIGDKENYKDTKAIDQLLFRKPAYALVDTDYGKLLYVVDYFDPNSVKEYNLIYFTPGVKLTKTREIETRFSHYQSFTVINLDNFTYNNINIQLLDKPTEDIKVFSSKKLELSYTESKNSTQIYILIPELKPYESLDFDLYVLYDSFYYNVYSMVNSTWRVDLFTEFNSSFEIKPLEKFSLINATCLAYNYNTLYNEYNYNNTTYEYPSLNNSTSTLNSELVNSSIDNNSFLLNETNNTNNISIFRDESSQNISNFTNITYANTTDLNISNDTNLSNKTLILNKNSNNSIKNNKTNNKTDLNNLKGNQSFDFDLLPFDYYNQSYIIYPNNCAHIMLLFNTSNVDKKNISVEIRHLNKTKIIKAVERKKIYSGLSMITGNCNNCGEDKLYNVSVGCVKTNAADAGYDFALQFNLNLSTHRLIAYKAKVCLKSIYSTQPQKVYAVFMPHYDGYYPLVIDDLSTFLSGKSYVEIPINSSINEFSKDQVFCGIGYNIRLYPNATLLLIGDDMKYSARPFACFDTKSLSIEIEH